MDAGALPPVAAEAVRLFLRSYPAGEERAEAAQLAMRYGILALRQHQQQQESDSRPNLFPPLAELRQLVARASVAQAVQSVLPKLDGRLVALQKQLDAYQEALGRSGEGWREQQRWADTQGVEAGRDSNQFAEDAEVSVAQVSDAPEQIACGSKETYEPSTYLYRRRQVSSAAHCRRKPSAKWRAGDDRRQWTDRQSDPPSPSQLQNCASKLQARIYPKWWFNLADVRHERQRIRPKTARPAPRLAYSAAPRQPELGAAYAQSLKPVLRPQCNSSQRGLDPPVAAQSPAPVTALTPTTRPVKRVKGDIARTGFTKRGSRIVESVVKADVAARTRYALQRIEARQRAVLDSVRQSSPVAYDALMRDIVQGYSHHVAAESIADAFLSNPWMRKFAASTDNDAVVNRFALDQPEGTWEPHEGQDLTPATAHSRPVRHKDQPNAYTSALSTFGIPSENAPQAAQPAVGQSKDWCPVSSHTDQPPMQHRFSQWVRDYGKLSTHDLEHWRSTAAGAVL